MYSCSIEVLPAHILIIRPCLSKSLSQFDGILRSNPLIPTQASSQAPSTAFDLRCRSTTSFAAAMRKTSRNPGYSTSRYNFTANRSTTHFFKNFDILFTKVHSPLTVMQSSFAITIQGFQILLQELPLLGFRPFHGPRFPSCCNTWRCKVDPTQCAYFQNGV
jgi:hypothetical protein